MALIQKAMAEKAPAPAEKTAAPKQAMTPEQESQEKLILAAMKVLYNDATHAAVMKVLSSAPNDPARALVATVSFILKELNRKSGGRITPDMMKPAASMLLMLAAELAEAAGIFQADPEMLQAAFQQLMGQGAQPQPQAAPQPAQPAPVEQGVA